MVGQRLWFRLHVRCSFYHSIHKDNGGRGWVPIPSQKKLRDLLEGKDLSKVEGVAPISFKQSFPFAFGPLPLFCYNFAGVGRSTLGFLLPQFLCPLLPFISFAFWAKMNMNEYPPQHPPSFSCQFPISHIPSPSLN